jgi:DNA-directed RNA polymerase specialized sigma subunit
MNCNEVRWKLHNYHTDIKRIDQLKEDLKEYRLMDNVKAQVITDMPMGSHNNNASTDKIVDRLDYIQELESELDSLMRTNRAIDSVYLYLREPQRSIIEMRYFLFRNPQDIRQCKYNWLEIAEEVNYSEVYCKKIDSKVIFQIQSKIHDNCIQTVPTQNNCIAIY